MTSPKITSVYFNVDIHSLFTNQGVLVGKDLNTTDGKAKKASCLASLSWRMVTITATSIDDSPRGISCSALLPVLKRDEVIVTGMDGVEKTIVKYMVLDFEGQALGISYATEDMIVGVFGFSLSTTTRKKAGENPGSMGIGHGDGYVNGAGESSDMARTAVDTYGFEREAVAPSGSSSNEEDETKVNPEMEERIKDLLETTTLMAAFLHDELGPFSMPERYR